MSNAQNLKQLKKGDSLFREGEMSKAMYLIRSGSIRIFKKKGDSQIEIDALRSGQIVGEMAFLDGNPRSASAEALQDSELVEISQDLYQKTISAAPEWVTVLIKAIVARLRATTTKVKNLEASSSAVDYSDGAGRRTFVFLSPHDCLKVATAILLVAVRYGEDVPEGKRARGSLIERYASQVMGIPGAKTTAFVDILRQGGVVASSESSGDVMVKDVGLLEQFISFVTEENQLEPSKRHDLTVKGFLVMSLIARHLDKYPKGEDGLAVVNVMEVKTKETPSTGKEPFRMDDFGELVRLGYATGLSVLSGTEQTSKIQPESFTKAARVQRILKIIDAVNEQKR